MAELTKDQLKEFRNSLNKWAIEKNPKILSNDGPQQANAVMTTIFNHAQKEVRIFASNMDGSISESVGDDGAFMSALDLFLLRPDSRLKVLIESIPESKKKLFTYLEAKALEELLVDEDKRKVDFRLVTDASISDAIAELRPIEEKSTVNGENIHFATGDNHMFRIEYDSKLHNANFSFNNLPITDLLITNFDVNFAKCHSVNK